MGECSRPPPSSKFPTWHTIYKNPQIKIVRKVIDFELNVATIIVRIADDTISHNLGQNHMAGGQLDVLPAIGRIHRPATTPVAASSPANLRGRLQGQGDTTRGNPLVVLAEGATSADMPLHGDSCFDTRRPPTSPDSPKVPGSFPRRLLPARPCGDTMPACKTWRLHCRGRAQPAGSWSLPSVWYQPQCTSQVWVHSQSFVDLVENTNLIWFVLED